MFQITFKSREPTRSFEGSIDVSLPTSSQVFHLFCQVRWPAFSGFWAETPLLSEKLCTLQTCLNIVKSRGSLSDRTCKDGEICEGNTSKGGEVDGLGMSSFTSRKVMIIFPGVLLYTCYISIKVCTMDMSWLLVWRAKTGQRLCVWGGGGEFIYCAVPENIHTPPTEGFLSCTALPKEIPVYFHTFLLKM